MDIAVIFIALFALITIGVPVGFSIGGATILALILFTNDNLMLLAQYNFSGLNSFPLMAIPFFILAGAVMSQGGIAKKIVDVANNAVGFLTGGLGACVVLASMFFAALSGSAMATVSAIGGMLLPEMNKKHYDIPYSTILICFAGTLGPIIPPSIQLVLYGVCTQTSISDLFIAGVFPGILMGIVLLITNALMCKKYGIGKPDLALIENINFKSYTIKFVKSLIDGFWALLTPVIILGGIYTGVFTPTEAAVVAVVYSLVISFFVYKTMNFKTLKRALVDTVVINGITSFLLGFSTIFAVYLSTQQVPAQITEILMGITDNKFLLLLILNIFFLILGCFMDNIPATLILAPILLPTLVGYGVDPVHFGIILSLNLTIGLVTPPYGCNLFVGCAIANIKMESMFKYLFPFLAAMIIVLMLVTYIPEISLALLK